MNPKFLVLTSRGITYQMLPRLLRRILYFSMSRCWRSYFLSEQCRKGIKAFNRGDFDEAAQRYCNALFDLRCFINQKQFHPFRVETKPAYGWLRPVPGAVRKSLANLAK